MPKFMHDFRQDRIPFRPEQKYEDSAIAYRIVEDGFCFDHKALVPVRGVDEMNHLKLPDVRAVATGPMVDAARNDPRAGQRLESANSMRCSAFVTSGVQTAQP